MNSNVFLFRAVAVENGGVGVAPPRGAADQLLTGVGGVQVADPRVLPSPLTFPRISSTLYLPYN